VSWKIWQIDVILRPRPIDHRALWTGVGTNGRVLPTPGVAGRADSEYADCLSVCSRSILILLYCTNFSPEKWGEWGTRPPCREKWGNAVPAPLHPCFTAIVKLCTYFHATYIQGGPTPPHLKCALPCNLSLMACFADIKLV